MSAARRPLDLWVAEQIEAIAIAIAMALVLKLFVVEAYQIPSGSMQPTILGDRETGIKDRVLADKLVSLLRPPRRWEVTIFRLPYDERALYVKRLAGLPGETLEIRGGDVWIDGAVARKPDHVNESVLKDVFPGQDGGLDVGRAFSATSDGITVRGTSAIFAPESVGELRLRGSVRDDYLHGYDPDWGIRVPANVGSTSRAVADLDLELLATLDPGARGLRLGFLADEGDLAFELAAADAGTTRVVLRPADGGEPRLLAELSRGLPAGRPVEITARWVDRQALLRVDGEEWVRVDDDVSGPRPEAPKRALVSLAADGGGTLEKLRLRRDIFYLPASTGRPAGGQARWEIGPGQYFALGDNTQCSLDSRSWELRTYALRDGRELTGFWFPNEGAPDRNPRALPGGRLAFADVHGDVFEFAAQDIVEQRLAPAPFIPRENLLGKAIAVFWPVVAPFRWKLIR